MLTIKEYDEQSDMFIIESAHGARFPVDAGALANLLNMHDEPSEFINLEFDVRVIA